MIKCVNFGDTDDPCGTCTFNPFYTVWPYFFATISLILACVSLWMLAVGLRTFEALYMITVFEGFMIISGAISGNLVLNEKEGQPPGVLVAYSCAIGIILVGLYILLRGERANSDTQLLNRKEARTAEMADLSALQIDHDNDHRAGSGHGSPIGDAEKRPLDDPDL